ncbi:MAG: signal peptidase I [Tenericutes bacterium]|nr:signal peptidase I [Mycoplasmatota bacterium]
MDNIKKIGKEIIPYLVIIILVLLIKAFIFTPVIVNGPSMMTNLHDKDIMILDKIGMKINGINRFDIVVIQTSQSKIIKRVIGLPGEIIEYKDNKLYINDKEVEDPYPSQITGDIERQLIPENTYYVLGDNRTDSVDSRILGPIDKNKILGHATFIIYPFNRFGSR